MSGVDSTPVDVWMSAPEMAAYVQNPDFVRGIQDLFAGPPVISTWVHPAGDWVEW